MSPDSVGCRQIQDIYSQPPRQCWNGQPEIGDWQLPEKGNQEMGDRIIEATGFIVAAHGTVQLVANAETFDYGNIHPMQYPDCRQ